MLCQLRIEVIIPDGSELGTTTNKARDSLQDYSTNDVYGQTSCMMFHTEQFIINRVFVENLSKCSHIVNNRGHNGHEMSKRETRVERRSPCLPLSAVTSQHILTSSQARETRLENFWH